MEVCALLNATLVEMINVCWSRLFLFFFSLKLELLKNIVILGADHMTAWPVCIPWSLFGERGKLLSL